MWGGEAGNTTQDNSYHGKIKWQKKNYFKLEHMVIQLQNKTRILKWTKNKWNESFLGFSAACIVLKAEQKGGRNH